MGESGEIEQQGAPEVAVVAHAGVVVLDGPRDLIDRLVADEPALAVAPPVTPSMVGAVDALTSLASLRGGGSGTSSMVFQLDDVGMELFNRGALAPSSAGDGFMRLFGQGADGAISAQGSLKALPMAPQQLLMAQMAMTTIALTAAIKEVQEAVERVEAKVQRLTDLLEAERFGDIVGVNRALRRRAEEVGLAGSLSDADWHAMDDVGIQIEQDLEGLRSFVRKRLRAAEDEGMRISGRVDALELMQDIGETLDLLVVAEDNLFLFQQLRLVRIRDTEPDHLERAEAEARRLMADQGDADRDLLDRARALVGERVTVGALEIHRVLSARAIVARASDVDEMLSRFGEQRSMRYEPISVAPLPGLSDAYAEARERSSGLAGGARRALGGVGSRVRRRDAPAAGVQSALDSPEPDVAEVAPASTPTRARVAAQGIRRLRRGQGTGGRDEGAPSSDADREAP